MAWSLGTPIGDSVRFLQLELARGDSGAVRLQLDRLMALPLRRDADRIGRFSSWPDFQSALIELREGNRPPYSGPRGDLVEKARRLYMELWGSKALKDSVARAKWDEAQRWMAMAWSRYGLPAGPAGERLGAWVQEPAGLTLQDGRTLDWNLLADSLRSVGVQAVWAELRNPRAATWPTALEHLHPAASGKTSPIATAPTPPNSTHPDTLDLPAAFVQAMRARQIEPHGVARLFRLPVPWLLPDSAVADLARDRLLQEDPNGAPLPALSWCVAANREHELAVLEELVRRTPLQGLLIDGLQSESPQGDYQPACRAAFEQQLGRPVPDWPLSVLPDSALAADWSRWQTEQITQFVRELSGRLHAARPGLELAVAIFPDPYEARDWHAQDWRTWAGEKLFDTYAPRLYDSDPGRLEARVQNLKAQLPARMLPLISAWDPADWQSRMPLALQLDALARMRGAGADGSILFSLNEAWLRHDAAWVSLAAHTLPPTTAPAAATSANSAIAKPTAAQ
jgi:hypothetical protein